MVSTLSALSMILSGDHDLLFPVADKGALKLVKLQEKGINVITTSDQ